jgi:hypothetical protein
MCRCCLLERKYLVETGEKDQVKTGRNSELVKNEEKRAINSIGSLSVI